MHSLKMAVAQRLRALAERLDPAPLPNLEGPTVYAGFRVDTTWAVPHNALYIIDTTER
jgi:hypothetical protein